MGEWTGLKLNKHHHHAKWNDFWHSSPPRKPWCSGYPSPNVVQSHLAANRHKIKHWLIDFIKCEYFLFTGSKLTQLFYYLHETSCIRQLSITAGVHWIFFKLKACLDKSNGKTTSCTIPGYTAWVQVHPYFREEPLHTICDHSHKMSLNLKFGNLRYLHVSICKFCSLFSYLNHVSTPTNVTDLFLKVACVTEAILRKSPLKFSLCIE